MSVIQVAVLWVVAGLVTAAAVGPWLGRTGEQYPPDDGGPDGGGAS